MPTADITRVVGGTPNCGEWNYIAVNQTTRNELDFRQNRDRDVQPAERARRHGKHEYISGESHGKKRPENAIRKHRKFRSESWRVECQTARERLREEKESRRKASQIAAVRNRNHDVVSEK